MIFDQAFFFQCFDSAGLFSEVLDSNNISTVLLKKVVGQVGGWAATWVSRQAGGWAGGQPNYLQVRYVSYI